MSNRKILILVTSADRLPNGRPTGVWLEEFAVPYNLLVEAGYDVTVVSPRGGKVPVDPHSLDDAAKTRQWARATAELERSLPLSEVKADGFDAVFLPGGHGTMVDFPDDGELKALLGAFAAKAKVVAAVCHGPAGLVGVKNADGSPLVAGKTVTSFTDAEEDVAGLVAAVPFLLESKLREEGANFVTGPNWGDHVEVDGLLVTGQNPASSASTARAVIELLGR